MRKTAPLQTPAWATWSAKMRPPRLEGTWLVTGTGPGRGRYFGTLIVAPGAKPEEFSTTIALRSLDSGAKLSRKGSGIVYAGYAWRGKNSGDAAAVSAAE